MSSQSYDYDDESTFTHGVGLGRGIGSGYRGLSHSLAGHHDSDFAGDVIGHDGFSSGLPNEIGYARNYRQCPHGLERTVHGKCVEPIVSQDLFVYKAPSFKIQHKKAHYQHEPKVHYNLVYIRSPTYDDHPLKPVVIPPPKQKTLVYLLSKKPHSYKQNVIEVPHVPQKPEVFFVNYNDGENPVLPGGIDLETALSQAAGPHDGKYGSGDHSGIIEGSAFGGLYSGGSVGRRVVGSGRQGFKNSNIQSFIGGAGLGGIGGGKINVHGGPQYSDYDGEIVDDHAFGNVDYISGGNNKGELVGVGDVADYGGGYNDAGIETGYGGALHSGAVDIGKSDLSGFARKIGGRGFGGSLSGKGFSQSKRIIINAPGYQ